MNENLNELVNDGTTDESAGTIETNVETNGDLTSASGGFAMPGEETTPVVDETVVVNENVNTEEADSEASGEEPDTTETETPTPAARITFADRAVDMGLAVLPGGTFHYADEFSEIAYKKVATLDGSGIVDNFELSHLAIFTKEAGAEQDWKYQNYVSDAYKFLGNATLINQIKESIQAVGDAELIERSFMDPSHTKIRHEIVISNPSTIDQVGTVYPMLNISNTYNGTGASRITFGMNIAESANVRSAFCTEKFGKIKQIHLSGAATELTTAVGDFINVFGANIEDMISENFNNHITEADMMKVLDKIPSKGRREKIAAELAPAEEGVASWSMTNWQLFLALTRFTSVEENLNAKVLMENIAERVLIVPQQMLDSLAAING